MSNSYATGLAFGVCFALLLYVAVYKLSKKKISNNYDERQELVRGRGYMYTTYVVMVLLLLDMLADSFGLYETGPLNHSFSNLVILMAGLMVYALYCIRNDSYFGVGINHKAYFITIAVVILLQLIALVFDFKDGSFMADGRLAFGPCSRILFIIAFTIILIAIYVQKKNSDAAVLDDEEQEVL